MAGRSGATALGEGQSKQIEDRHHCLIDVAVEMDLLTEMNLGSVAA